MISTISYIWYYIDNIQQVHHYTYIEDIIGTIDWEGIK